jgi:hypothetical protein
MVPQPNTLLLSWPVQGASCPSQARQQIPLCHPEEECLLLRLEQCRPQMAVPLLIRGWGNPACTRIRENPGGHSALRAQPPRCNTRGDRSLRSGSNGWPRRGFCNCADCDLPAVGSTSRCKHHTKSACVRMRLPVRRPISWHLEWRFPMPSPRRSDGLARPPGCPVYVRR